MQKPWRPLRPRAQGPNPLGLPVAYGGDLGGLGLRSVTRRWEDIVPSWATRHFWPHQASLWGIGHRRLAPPLGFRLGEAALLLSSTRKGK